MTEITTPTSRAARHVRLRSLPGVYAAGLGMGAADLVPGVSGGTVALVVGIYDRLVGAIRQGVRALATLLRGRPRDAITELRAVDWPFLLVLLAGIGSAVVLLAGVLERLLVEQPVLLSAAFLGLVLGSTVVACDEVRRPDARELAVGVVVTVVTFVLLGLRPATVADPSVAMLVGGGAVAICAMILPGISGSFLLLLMGLYAPVLAAVSDRDLVTIGAVGLGAVLGLASFSTLLSWLLHAHRRVVMAAIVGLLLGSARVLWPWPAGSEGVGDTRLGAPDGQVLAALALGLGATVLVVAVARLASSRSGAVELRDAT